VQASHRHDSVFEAVAVQCVDLITCILMKSEEKKVPIMSFTPRDVSTLKQDNEADEGGLIEVRINWTGKAI
jgi:hypothetical protein